ncbi:MAG: SEC59/DGK1/VTE5 family protein [Candidatus Bathyarchaeia archaeon]
MFDKLVLNTFLLVLCYVYVIVVIVISGWMLKISKSSGKYSRKFLHMMIGNLTFLIPFFTLNSFPLNFPFFVAAPFVAVTFLATSYSPSCVLRERLKGLSSITENGHNLGLCFYAISYTLLALFFSSRAHVIAAGVLPMAYGDALAAIVGEKYGKLHYCVFTKKSVEGSAVMFLVSFLIVNASLVFFSAVYSLPMFALNWVSLAVALVTTLAEAFSPLGFDNITVPLLGAAVFLLLSGGI